MLFRGEDSPSAEGGPSLQEAAPARRERERERWGAGNKWPYMKSKRAELYCTHTPTHTQSHHSAAEVTQGLHSELVPRPGVNPALLVGS